MAQMDQHLYDFGDFRYDPKKRRLSQAGALVLLSPKACEVLHHLLQHVGEVVEREELLKVVWGESIVEDANLTVAISTLRKALGQDKEDHLFIKTLPRVGYCFIGAVRVLAQESLAKKPVGEIRFAPQSRQTEKPLSNALSRRQWMTRLAGGALALASGITAWQVWQKRGRALPFQQFSLERLPIMGHPQQVALSHDGKRVAYSLLENGKHSLWLYDLGARQSVQVQTALEHSYRGLSFAPDDKDLYFARWTENSSTTDLFRIPSQGGEARFVMNDVPNPITFSPAGDQFAFVRESRSAGESSLLIGRFDGSSPQVLATRKVPEFFPLDGAAWSPDGQLIATPAGSSKPSTYFTVVGVNVKTGAEQAFTTKRWENVRRAQWLADGRGLVVSIQIGEHSHQLCLLSYPEGNVTEITQDLSVYPRGASLATVGNVMVASQEKRLFSLWLVNGQVGSEPQPISSGTDTHDGLDGVVWLPGNRFGYVSVASGRPELWVTQMGGRPQKFSAESVLCQYPARSSDGRWLVMSRSVEQGTQIWRVAADGTNWQPVTQGRLDLDAQISPDNHWIVYSSEHSGRRTIWKASLEGGVPVQLTESPSESPVISPDGAWIACLYWPDNRSDKQKIAIIPFAGGAPIQYHDVPFPSFPKRRFFRWCSDGKSLICISTNNGCANLNLQPLNGAPHQQLTNFKTDYITSFDIAPDGKQLVIARVSLVGNLMLLKDI